MGTPSQISTADAPSLALDWNHEWLIPATTNAWFPVKIFKDVALPGTYTVTASTNITVRYNGVFLEPGGETVSFPQSQSQETLEVQAAAPGAAALTVSFTGTGTATNYNCSTYVNITAWGVEFFESEFTDYNFSPSLGENGSLGVRIINASADAAQQFDFKIEIVREIENNSEQHIDWVPTGNGSAAESRDLDFTSSRFDWDGVSSMTYSSAVNGRDSFQGVEASAVRVFPAVTAGQPVPPPFVTAVAKIIRKSDSLTVCEARKRVCIPQVVKILYDEDAVTTIKAGKDGLFDGVPTTFIQPVSDAEWETMRTSIPSGAQNLINYTDANIRFVSDAMLVLPPFKTIWVVSHTSGVFGLTYDFSSMNIQMAGVGYVDVAQLYANFPVSSNVINGVFSLPATPNEIRLHCIRTAVHESSHMLGLVENNAVLNGDSEYHNKDPNGRRVMDDGATVTYEVRFGRSGQWNWYPLNSTYLKFVLPKK